jgi:hypothetical protein
VWHIAVLRLELIVLFTVKRESVRVDPSSFEVFAAGFSIPALYT